MSNPHSKHKAQSKLKSSLRKTINLASRTLVVGVVSITGFVMTAQATDSTQATHVNYNTTSSQSANLPEYKIAPEIQTQIEQLTPAQRIVIESLVEDINTAKSSITVDNNSEISADNKELYNFIQLLEELGLTDDMNENISRRMVLNFMQEHPQVTSNLLNTYQSNYLNERPQDDKEYAQRYSIMAIASIVENSPKYGNDYAGLARDSQYVSTYLTPEDLERNDQSYLHQLGGEESAFLAMNNDYENMLNNNISKNLDIILQNQQTIEEYNKTIEQNQQTIEQNQQTIEQNQQTIEQNQQTIEQNQQNIAQLNKNIEQNRQTRQKIDEMNKAFGLD